MTRPHNLALTPDQIEEARCLKAMRSWEQLARRYKCSKNQVRYALDADRQRELARGRNLRRYRNRGGRNPKAEFARRKAKALALGFRSVYQMGKVLSGKATMPKPRLVMQVPWAVPGGRENPEREAPGPL